MEMFCYQCQETAKGTGCTIQGVCGKKAETSARMDLLLYAVRGVSIINQALREKDEASREASHFVIDALFATITNANFDNDSLDDYIRRGFEIKNLLQGKAKKQEIELPDLPEVNFYAHPDDYEKDYSITGVLSETNPDIRALKQLSIYGAKGMAAYARHAANLGYESEDVYAIIENAMAQVSRPDLSVDEAFSLVLMVGDGGVKVMDLLDRANTGTYGNPEATEVNIGVGDKPGILISGHDLHDLYMLLEQTKDSGVDVYTHSEMLPGCSYPVFKKYPHLKGNYGNAWWKQVDEFKTFNGVFLFTSNCIVPPRKDCNYLDRVYTTGVVAMPGCKFIPEGKEGKPKDFSELIEHAKKCLPPTAIEEGTIPGGYAHHQVVELAPKILDLIRRGKIRKFVVMAGCDGRFPIRDYYTKFAEALPEDCVILTAGCAKYRYNKLKLGDIEGVPRVIDCGQCNDSYSIVRIAMALKDALGLKSINELPVVYNIAWYEQKAVIVLLALLALGVQNIHTGPTLPAFFTPEILKVLKEKFNIGTISTVEEDIKNLIG